MTRDGLADQRSLYLALKTKRELLTKQIIQRAREDVNVFAEYCFKDEANGCPIVQQPFHRAWHKHADEHDKVVIVGPRGHGKTENFAVIRPLWMLGRDPNIRIKVVSADKETAMKRVNAVRQHIETNERLHEVFPGLRCGEDQGPWSASAITVRRDRILKEPSYDAKGITQTGEGGRCDVLIGEDVCDANNALRLPAMRAVVKRAWSNTWSNLLDPEHGRIVYICTLWHRDDLSHELIANPEYKTLNISIGADDEPIWPAKWSKRRLLAKKRSIGRVNYDRGYRNLSISDEDRMFDRQAILDMRKAGVDMFRRRLPVEWPRYSGVDLAIGKTKASKYSVIFTFAIDPQMRRYVVDVKRGQWSSIRLAQKVFETHVQFHPSIIAVETNGYQKALIEWTKDKYGVDLPIIGLFTGSDKNAVDAGMPALTVQVEDGLWIVPQDGPLHADDCQCSRCQWCRELEDYPAGKFTDTVMASWLADKAYRFKRVKVSNLEQTFTVPGDGRSQMHDWSLTTGEMDCYLTGGEHNRNGDW